MSSSFPELFDRYRQQLRALRLKPPEVAILLNLGEKILWRCVGTTPTGNWPISFSLKPISCIEHSEGTPIGLHCVAERYGDGAPHGTVFIARQSTGLHYADRPDAGPTQPNLVTTRILRLRGLQPGLNAGAGCDSFKRFIYIHGTNHPDAFPANRSAGCILMRDDDLIALFDQTAVGCHVFIAPPAPTSSSAPSQVCPRQDTVSHPRAE